MVDCKIELLFPTPIMFNRLDRKLTKKELDFVEFHSNHVYKNSGNVTSNNTYILHEPEMKKLHDYLLKTVNIYIDKIIKPKHKVEAFITQSWLNYTKKGEFHHKHEHPNSFLSGVFYVNADEMQDKITFHRFGYKQLQLATENYDILNADSWWFNIKTNDMVIFPSSLTHHVDNVTADKTRISLAFNTFIKGTLGDSQSLTEFKNA